MSCSTSLASPWSAAIFFSNSLDTCWDVSEKENENGSVKSNANDLVNGSVNCMEIENADGILNDCGLGHMKGNVNENGMMRRSGCGFCGGCGCDLVRRNGAGSYDDETYLWTDTEGWEEKTPYL